jgi:hypothetical protein
LDPNAASLIQRDAEKEVDINDGANDRPGVE